MSRPRVVIAGLGDIGLLTAIHLAKHYVDVIGITSKPELVSGQELGMRLARPERWARDYRVGWDRFTRLDGAQVVHGTLTSLDLEGSSVGVTLADGTLTAEPYDVLVISTGVSNGFWRRPHLQTSDDVTADLERTHAQLAGAASIAVVGGGAAAVSAALNLATQWPDKHVGLYFPGDKALPAHHPRVWSHVRRRLLAAQVRLHPGHRAVVPDGFACDAITLGPVSFSTGQEPAAADAVVWAIGRVTPNTSWLPADLLDESGFVKVRSTLQSLPHDNVFAIGDVAASDPLRSTARNRADGMLARNILAVLDDGHLTSFKPPKSRWGSVLGPQRDGLQVFAPSGKPFRFPHWSVERVLQPWIVRRGIYKGIRKG